MSEFEAPAIVAAAQNNRISARAGTPIIPVTIMGVGLYLAWFGVHYWMSDVKWPSDPIKAVLTGQPVPSNARAATSVQGLGGIGVSGGPVAPSSSTEIIASTALKYQAAGYNFGGPADTVGNWDCSSFVSKVLGQDLGLPLPGGGKWGDPGYPPNAHGPGSTAYMLYGTGIDRSQVQAGDLIVSVEHIGIMISATQMISAQQPSTGTRVSSIDNFPSGPPVFRRVQLSPLFRQN